MESEVLALRARTDALTSLVMLGGMLARLATCLGGSEQLCTPEFARLNLAFLPCAALSPLLYTAARPWYARHRAWVAAPTRLAMAAILAVPYAIPDALTANPLAFAWIWLFNTHAVSMHFAAVGYRLPLGVHVAVSAAQQAMMGWTAAARCGLLPARPGASFLAFPPSQGLFSGLSILLDWPFRMVAPPDGLGVDLSDEAACLLCTLWLQATLGVLLPTLLLCTAGAAGYRHRAPGEGGTPDGGGITAAGVRAGQGGTSAVQPPVGKLLAALRHHLHEQPVAVGLFCVQLLWMLLRAAGTVLDAPSAAGAAGTAL